MQAEACLALPCERGRVGRFVGLSSCEEATSVEALVTAGQEVSIAAACGGVFVETCWEAFESAVKVT